MWWRWVIALTPGDKLNRQLNVGLAFTTCSIQIFIVIACLSYDCIPRWQQNVKSAQWASSLTPLRKTFLAPNGFFHARIRSFPPQVICMKGLGKHYQVFISSTSRLAWSSAGIFVRWITIHLCVKWRSLSRVTICSGQSSRFSNHGYIFRVSLVVPAILAKCVIYLFLSPSRQARA